MFSLNEQKFFSSEENNGDGDGDSCSGKCCTGRRGTPIQTAAMTKTGLTNWK